MSDPITIKSGLYEATVYVEGGWPAGVYFDNAAVAAGDPEFAKLASQEAALEDRRWSHRGDYPDVDALYDQKNARYMQATTRIAGELAPAILDAVEGTRVDPGGLRFDAHAGCRDCRCTPGVVGLLGAQVNVRLASENEARQEG